MPVYRCRVADARGRATEVLRDAASEEALLRDFSARDGFLLSVEEVREGPRGAGRRFSRRAVGDLTALLALMLASGLSLKDSLELAQAASGGGRDDALAAMLLEGIRKGGTLADALDTVPESFPPVYRGLVRIGERIGNLDQVFSRLSSYLAEDKKLRDRIGTALLYPSLVLGVALLSVLFLVFWLLPRMKEVFLQLGPEMGRKVEALTGSLTAAMAVLAAAAVAAACFLVFAARARRRGGPAAERIDAAILRLPLAAPFLIRREVLGFSFAMETLTAAGVGVEEALGEGATAVQNAALRREILSVRDKVMKGGRLSAAFSDGALFPSRVGRWIAVGERVGHVERVFGQLRAYYQQEVDQWLGRLMALVEPALIAVLGVLIVVFVVSFIVPVFSLFGSAL